MARPKVKRGAEGEDGRRRVRMVRACHERGLEVLVMVLVMVVVVVMVMVVREDVDEAGVQSIFQAEGMFCAHYAVGCNKYTQK
jgi:hypothetical protein